MDRFDAMQAFVAVADLHGFAPAARKLGLSPSAVTRLIAALEERLGARLLQRTTRQVALTDVGESFFVQCTRILEDMETARCSARPEAPVRGNMRITAPVVFGSTRLGPLVVDFMHRHPELSLNVELSDRSVDLIEEGYDLAIRTRPTTGAGLVAFLDARLVPGAPLVVTASGFDEKLPGADLIITGEGRADSQTAYGKAPGEVAKRGKASRIPVLLIAGSKAPGWEVLSNLGVAAVVTLDEEGDNLQQLMGDAGEMLRRATARACRERAWE